MIALQESCNKTDIIFLCISARFEQDSWASCVHDLCKQFYLGSMYIGVSRAWPVASLMTIAISMEIGTSWLATPAEHIGCKEIWYRVDEWHNKGNVWDGK